MLSFESFFEQKITRLNLLQIIAVSGLQTYEQRRSKSPSCFKVSLSLEKKKVLFISIVEEGKIENVLPHPLLCLSISEIANQDMIKYWGNHG